MRRSFEVGVALLVTLLSAAACGDDNNNRGTTNTGVGGSTSQTPTGSQWTLTSYANAFELNGIWGSGPNDIWAVGDQNNIAHWNGAAWSTPLSGTTDEFTDVWGSGPSDVYAVGDSVVHWDGTSWTTVNADILRFTQVGGIWGSSASDIWLVGGDSASSYVGNDSPFVVHWDGSAWTLTSLSFETNSSEGHLNAVWGTGADNVWAVGEMGQNGVIVHWDGQTWSTVLQGSSTLPLFGLSGIWGSGPADIWAVGLENVAHFDGTTWKVDQCPIIASIGNVGDTVTPCPSYLVGVWGSGANDVWAGGAYGVIAHWNGTAWTMSSYGQTNYVNAIWGSGPNNVWAVGGLLGGAILHYSP